MFELDGGDHGGNRGFYEPPKAPVRTLNDESNHPSKTMKEPTKEPELFHEQVREALQKSIAKPAQSPPSPANPEISPIKSEVSPVRESANTKPINKPLADAKALRPDDDQVSPVDGVVSPFSDAFSPVRTPGARGLRNHSVNKNLPPEPGRGNGF